MTKNTLKKIEIKNITTKLCEHSVFKRNQFLALFAVKKKTQPLEFGILALEFTFQKI